MAIEFLTVPFAHPDFPALSVLSGILAAAGHRRLRLEEGKTYGVSASMSGLRGAATFGLTWRVAPNDTVTSIREMLEAIEHAKTTPPNAALLDTIKRARNQSSVEVGDTNGEALGSLLAMVASGASVEMWNASVARFAAVMPEDVQRVAAKYLDINHMMLVVAGEGARLKSTLESLDLGAPEIR